jgi:hypothetical protein
MEECDFRKKMGERIIEFGVHMSEKYELQILILD